MQFRFIVENDASLPIDPKFWNYLLSSAQKDWEMFVYEQDWLSEQFTKMKALQVSVFISFNMPGPNCISHE